MSVVRLAMLLAGSDDPYRDALQRHGAVAALRTLDGAVSAGDMASIDGLYVAPGAPGRAEAILSAARAGRPVLAPGRLARSTEELDALEQALGPAAHRVFAPYTLRYTAAAQNSLAAAASLTVRSVTGLYRTHAGQGADWRDALDSLADYALAVAGGPAERVQASAILKGAERATVGVVVLAALPGGALTNLECGAVLPPDFPQPATADLEILSDDAVIRVEPYRQSVAAYGGPAGIRHVDWTISPEQAIVDAFVQAVQGRPVPGLGLERQRLVAGFIAQVEHSLAAREVRSR